MNLIVLAKNSKLVEKITNFFKSNIVSKFIGVIITWIIALIPVWIYLLLRIPIDPVGFWQELALFIVFLIMGGWLQFILIILACAITYSILTDEPL